jgi:hypothetical protein
MVIVAVPDTNVRRRAEELFAANNDDFNSVFVPSFEIIGLRRPSLSRTEVEELLLARGIEGALLVTVTDSGSTTRRVPPRARPRCRSSRGGLTLTGCPLGGSAVLGRQVQKPWSSFFLSVIDASTAETVWSANATTSGDENTPFLDLFRAMIDRAVSRMRDDGLVVKPDADKRPQTIV